MSRPMSTMSHLLWVERGDDGSRSSEVAPKPGQPENLRLFKG